MRYKQKIGPEKDIFGGGGQGVPLGLWIFCFMIDRAGPQQTNQPLGQIITQPLNKRQPMDKTKKKWVDDFTVLTSINLQDTLVPDPSPVRPVPYHSRTEHILPDEHNPLQPEIDRIVTYSHERKMVLNPKKTKAMIFNSRRKYDVLPQLSAEPGSQIEVVEQHKIVGQIIRSDLKTISNTENICRKAYKRMWVIRRLKSMNCPESEMLEVLQQQIISVCEVGVAYWGPMITQNVNNMLERTLKTAHYFSK